MKLLLLISLTLLINFTTQASPAEVRVLYLDSAGTILSNEMLAGVDSVLMEQNTAADRPHPLFERIQKKHKLNKKITAAVLAFPFPFGIVGLHRIYMGTKPYVPIVYIATAGGVFGILPFIDFCVLMFDKDFDRYKNNGKVFMWVKN